MTWHRLGPRGEQALATLKRGVPSCLVRQDLAPLGTAVADMASLTASALGTRFTEIMVLDRKARVRSAVTTGTRSRTLAARSKGLPAMLGDIERAMGVDGLHHLARPASPRSIHDT